MRAKCSLAQSFLLKSGLNVNQIFFKVQHTLVFILFFDCCPSLNSLLQSKAVVLSVLFSLGLRLEFLFVSLQLFLLDMFFDLFHVTKFIKCIFLYIFLDSFHVFKSLVIFLHFDLKKRLISFAPPRGRTTSAR